MLLITRLKTSKGMPHCPFTHKRVDKPFLLVVFALNQKYPSAEEDDAENPGQYK